MERGRQRHKEIRQIKLFGVERGDRRGETETEREKEREAKERRERERERGEREEREREARERQERGERERERERYVKSSFLGWKDINLGERERETQRDTSNQAFWGGKTPIWDREEGRERERERHRDIHQIKPTCFSLLYKAYIYIYRNMSKTFAG